MGPAGRSARYSLRPQRTGESSLYQADRVTGRVGATKTLGTEWSGQSIAESRGLKGSVRSVTEWKRNVVKRGYGCGGMAVLIESFIVME